MKHYEETHILALDVRHSRIGYALFSGPKRLLDWGASTVPSQCSNRAQWIERRMEQLLRYGTPASLVTKQRRQAKLPGNTNGEPILETIRSIAKEHGVAMQVLGRDEIQSAFRVFQAHTKEEIACVLVGIFPELLARLPTKRKKWQPEPRGMIAFDAIATGFTYWRRSPPHE